MAKKLRKDLTLRDGRILVLQDMSVGKEKITAAGIISETAKGATKASSGVVVVIDPNIEHYEVGDRLLFSPYSGFALSYCGDPGYLLLGEHEVFGHYSGAVGDVEIR